jgi:hypothetical protein
VAARELGAAVGEGVRPGADRLAGERPAQVVGQRSRCGVVERRAALSVSVRGACVRRSTTAAESRGGSVSTIARSKSAGDRRASPAGWRPASSR